MSRKETLKMIAYTYTKLDPEFKAKWIAALRSRKYKQGLWKLRTDNDRFCCIGVACDIQYPECWHRDPDSGKFSFLGEFTLYPNPGAKPDEVPMAKICYFAVRKLADMNDSGKYSFSQIADWIEENL